MRFPPLRLFLVVTLLGCAQPGPMADVIYHGGPILTMEDDDPQVEALAVGGGRILAVGSMEDVSKSSGPSTRSIDLAGRTLMPGFFDGHSHLTMTSAKLAVVNLDPPPAGPADSIRAIQQALRERLETAGVGEIGWLVGWGYDHAMLEEARHPDRFDLDAVSSEVPIVLIHFSSHQVVVNGKGLELVGISATTPDPKGGRILRVDGGSEPNGLLQETAMFPVVFPILNGLLGGGAGGSVEGPLGDAVLERAERAVGHYVAQGYTTLTEMAGTLLAIRLLRALAEEDRLPVDVIAVPLVQEYGPEEVRALRSETYDRRFRVGGAKIILDGGSPGRSAYLQEPYHVQLPGEVDYRGYSHFASQADVDALVTSHFEAGNPVYIHALGDAAVEQAIVALRAAREAVPGADRGPQLIHVQQAKEEQLAALAELDAHITFQVAHNFYFGDFHVAQIYGPERSARLNPARSAIDRGLSVSLHHDSPVHPVDPWMLVWAAVNRTTRSGRVIGPEQRITVLEALQASTLEAARQFHEAHGKGSLSVGKRADLIVLDRNPLEIDPTTLREVRVLETVKDGETVFRATNGMR